jgi:hypothetical protein
MPQKREQALKGGSNEKKKEFKDLPLLIIAIKRKIILGGNIF